MRRNDQAGRSSQGEVGGVLAGLLADRGVPELLARIALEEVWDSVVGELMARHSRPERIERGKLIVVVPNPTWNSTLQTMEARILQEIRRRCPDLPVDGLRIMLGAPPKPRGNQEPRQLPQGNEVAEIPLTGTAKQQIRDTVAVIEDEELREAQARAMAKQQQGRQWRLAHGWRPSQGGETLEPPPRPEPKP
jgi:predicted nucleic acid-binding Zn ribbon protein